MYFLQDPNVSFNMLQHEPDKFESLNASDVFFDLSYRFDFKPIVEAKEEY